MKIGFIGAGNMGGAIFRGFIKENAVRAEDIYIFDIQQEKIKEDSQRYGINACSSYKELISSVDYVVLAVKPNVFEIVIPEISTLVEEYNPVVISIAAGMSIDSIVDLFEFEPAIIRIMPNINAEICLSTSAYCCNKKVSKEKEEEIVKCFGAIGYITEISEKDFSIFMAIASCSPAYVYLFIDSLAKGAQKCGMNKKKALEIATSAVIGSSNYLKFANEHPWELIDKVCSPGGTTIEGICTLEENGFESAIVKAVENSVNKDKKLDILGN